MTSGSNVMCLARAMPATNASGVGAVDEHARHVVDDRIERALRGPAR